MDVLKTYPPRHTAANEYYCVSAWHAALHLLMIQFMTCTSPLPKHFVYRGQANAAWPLSSTLERMTEHDQRIDKRATWLFVNTLRTKIRGLGSVVDRAGLCALSRHYGLSSHLLDFTGDPAVAIWFACSDSTTAARDARVLAIDAKSFTRLGGRTIAPPPFEGRMAAQIAVSLDARGYRTNVLGQQMLSTVFPVPRRECPFTLFRDGELVQLLGGSEWLARLAPHCRAYALAAGGLTFTTGPYAVASRETRPLYARTTRNPSSDSASNPRTPRWASPLMAAEHENRKGRDDGERETDDEGGTPPASC